MRVKWTMPGQQHWYASQVPTAFISLYLPNYLMDLPMSRTYINCYNDSWDVVDVLIGKLCGDSELKGTSEENVWCGRWDTKLQFAGFLAHLVHVPLSPYCQPLSDQGLVFFMQILLDKPMKYKDDPPDKKGAKYIWFSSAGKTLGVSSGSPVLLVGNSASRTVYVTEGILKAYIAHAVMNRTFISTAGSNSIDQLRPMFQFLAQNGTELIIEAEDMDKYSNEAVAKCASNVYLLARSFGMEYRRLTWNPNYKGIDDWQLALRRRDRRIKEENAMSFKEKYLLGLCDFENIFDYIELWHNRPDDGIGLARFLGLTDSEYATLCSKSDAVLETILKTQRRGQRFRIYQLDFGKENRTIPFAFRGIEDLHAAGHDHPPAAKYKLIWDDVIICPTAWQEEEVLRHIAAHYGDHMPEQYLGRPVSPSDVIELYDEECRRYFYVDTSGFVSVRFAPFLAKPMKDLDEESS